MQQHSMNDGSSHWQKLRDMPGAAHIPPHATDPSSYKHSFDFEESPSVAMSNWRRQRDKQKVDRLLPIVTPSMKLDYSPLAGGKYGVTKKRRKRKGKNRNRVKKTNHVKTKKRRSTRKR